MPALFGLPRTPQVLWTPDTPPGSPSTYDDEFNVLSGAWTTLGSLDTLNVTDFAGHLHMKKTTSGTQLDGIYKTSPSPAYTVTCKVTDRLAADPYHWAGLFIGEAGGAGKFVSLGQYFNVGFFKDISPWTNRTTRGTPVGAGVYFFAPYLRMIVTSSTSVTYQWSIEGYVWTTLGTYNPGFTPAIVGLFVTGFGAIAMDALFDWIRFT